MQSTLAFSQHSIISDNVLVGPSASGLAGAFTAVADDPTAIIYNPAGLVHITANKRSLSYNAYMNAAYRVENVLYNSEWKSEATYTPFFVGTSYRSPTVLPDWTFAGAAYDRGIYSARQRWSASGKDSLANINGNSTAYDGSYESVSRRSASALTVAGAAARATRFGAVGLTIGLRNESESSQEFTKSSFGPFDVSGKSAYINATTNDDSEAKGYGIELNLGTFWKKDRWTFGASVGQLNYKFQKKESTEDSSNSWTDADGLPSTTRIDDKDVPDRTINQQSKRTDKYPFGLPPVRYRLGLAHKLSQTTRWSADIIGRAHSHTEESKIQPGADGAIGIDTAFNENFSTSFGLFTAMDPTNTLSSTGYRRSNNYVDSLGITSMLMYRADSWALSLGALYQKGQGAFGSNDTRKKDINVEVSSVSASFTSDQ